MSKDLVKAFSEAVTATSTTAAYPVGVRRFENGREYIYVKAGSGGLNASEACEVDATDLTGGTVKTSVNSVAGGVFGVSETAIAAASFGWVTVRGAAQCKVANGVAARDILSNSGAAGVLAKPANTDIAGQRAVALEANSSGSAAAKTVYLI